MQGVQGYPWLQKIQPQNYKMFKNLRKEILMGSLQHLIITNYTTSNQTSTVTQWKKKSESWIEVIPTFLDAHREEDYSDI